MLCKQDATEEIIQVLSSVCVTTSLAHLTMIFPSNAEWRRVTRPPQTIHSIYVHEFLGNVFAYSYFKCYEIVMHMNSFVC